MSAQTTDRLKKCLTADGEAIVVSIDATELIRETMARTEAWPPAMLHLGQAMMAAILMQQLPDRNEDERLELQWKPENGPFGSLFAECRGGTYARGTVFKPQAEVTDLKTPLGAGLLQVRRVKARGNVPISTGIVSAGGNVLTDLLEYLEKSEQKICAMGLWVDIAWDEEKAKREGSAPFTVRHAYGYLVHVLPKASEALTNSALLRWDRHIESLGPISQWVLGDNPSSDILSFVSAEFKPNVINERDLAFFCTCSEERAERALALMKDAEANDATPLTPEALEAQAKVRCEFCGRTYLLNNQDGVDPSKLN